METSPVTFRSPLPMNQVASDAIARDRSRAGSSGQIVTIENLRSNCNALDR